MENVINAQTQQTLVEFYNNIRTHYNGGDTDEIVTDCFTAMTDEQQAQILRALMYLAPSVTTRDLFR